MGCAVCGKLAPSTACTPLLVGGEVIGSVLVGSQEALGPDDERRVAESVAQAAPVLANLRNLALAEARAATDALTGLPNRRALRDSLTRMLAQSGRTMSPLSVIALDLDHFKAINDTYGHDRGDAVLAAVGDMLTRSVRNSDLAARTGGEEFVVLLPDTGAEGAQAVAEKLRATMATVTGLGLSKALSASFGVATCPDHATDDSGLLRLADRALYTAKAAGRDRVEIS
ncbi:MAG: GGDEF domain-containing protein, partial [Actinomycetota bacterium]|nr:GGDEF domain-containing protein [Actinomycetota bacterium]